MPERTLVPGQRAVGDGQFQVSRSSRNCAISELFICGWRQRDSNAEPSVWPLTVWARITVGAPRKLPPRAR